MAEFRPSNFVFTLHYYFTVIFLLALAILVTWNQMIAVKTVDCSVNEWNVLRKRIDQKSIDSNCKYRTFVWIDSEVSVVTKNLADY